MERPAIDWTPLSTLGLLNAQSIYKAFVHAWKLSTLTANALLKLFAYPKNC